MWRIVCLSLGLMSICAPMAFGQGLRPRAEPNLRRDCPGLRWAYGEGTAEARCTCARRLGLSIMPEGLVRLNDIETARRFDQCVSNAARAPARAF